MVSTINDYAGNIYNFNILKKDSIIKIYAKSIQNKEIYKKNNIQKCYNSKPNT